MLQGAHRYLLILTLTIFSLNGLSQSSRSSVHEKFTTLFKLGHDLNAHILNGDIYALGLLYEEGELPKGTWHKLEKVTKDVRKHHAIHDFEILIPSSSLSDTVARWDVMLNYYIDDTTSEEKTYFAQLIFHTISVDGNFKKRKFSEVVIQHDDEEIKNTIAYHIEGIKPRKNSAVFHDAHESE